MNGQCIACSKRGQIDRAHIRSKGAGGSWDDENILYLCRECHRRQHALGWYRFTRKFPSVAEALDAKGWKIREELGQMKLRRKC